MEGAERFRRDIPRESFRSRFPAGVQCRSGAKAAGAAAAICTARGAT
jgi:hypothetical protein